MFGFVSSWLEEHVARIGDLYVVKSGRREGAGRALVEAVIENLRARGATHLILSANLEALPFYEKLGFREESRNLVLPLEVRDCRRRPLVRLDPHPDGRPRRDRAGGAPVRAAAAGRLERQHRRAAAQRLDRRLRRRLRPRPVDAAPTGPRALGANRRRRPGGRGRARAGRPLHPVRRRPHRRRVSLRSRALRRAAARRRDRSRRESARRRTADGRRSGRRSAPWPVRPTSPEELPPPQELLSGIAGAIGLEGAEHGWADAPEIPNAIAVERQ